MKSPIYAIGDIHGHLDKLEEVMARIITDGGHEAEVVFLGDLVDRGPDSKGVIDFVLKGLEQGRNWSVLTGNHDRMLRYFLELSPRVDMRLRPDLYWLHDRLGGRDTLASYGLHFDKDARLSEIHAAARAKVPTKHVEFYPTSSNAVTYCLCTQAFALGYLWRNSLRMICAGSETIF